MSFPTALSAWPTVVAFGLKNQTGQLSYVALLTAARVIALGDAPVFLAGELEFPIG